MTYKEPLTATKTVLYTYIAVLINYDNTRNV